MLYKKGDKVKVWSLQSFHHGGFLKGAPAFVRQDQQNPNGSVILCVIRNICGEYKIDKNYEVYSQQIQKTDKGCWGAEPRLKNLRKLIMKGIDNPLI